MLSSRTRRAVEHVPAGVDPTTAHAISQTPDARRERAQVPDERHLDRAQQPDGSQKENLALGAPISSLAPSSAGAAAALVLLAAGYALRGRV